MVCVLTIMFVSIVSLTSILIQEFLNNSIGHKSHLLLYSIMNSMNKSCSSDVEKCNVKNIGLKEDY